MASAKNNKETNDTIFGIPKKYFTKKYYMAWFGVVLGLFAIFIASVAFCVFYLRK